eukprot:tig00020563_g11202.t1
MHREGFRDRKHGGEVLADLLEAKYGRPHDAVVIGLPRGGLPVAEVVAQRLDAPLDILASRKIGAPDNEEFAIGAVTESGTRVLNDE